MFGISGCLALLVDIGVLALSRPMLGYYGGRAVSFWAAATFTWWFNRSLTFSAGRAKSEQTISQEYLRYLTSMGVGGAVNYAVYALCVTFLPMAAAYPSIGVALGSLAGLGLNFWSARRILS